MGVNARSIVRGIALGFDYGKTKLKSERNKALIRTKQSFDLGHTQLKEDTHSADSAKTSIGT